MRSTAKYLMACACACAPAGAACATPAIATDSAVYVEHAADSGRLLVPADRLARGDRVIAVVTWYRLGGGDGSFVITNPLPASLAYQQSAQDGQDVSVDGGRTWGRLGTLRVRGHLATPEDVTHVRWRIPAAAAARGRGQIAYSGIVR